MWEAKHAVGDTVYIRNQAHTLTGIKQISGEWYYQVERWAVGWWLETLITSAEDWQARQAQIATDTEAREKHDADVIARLEETEPARKLFETDEEYERFYVQWAYGYWGVEMPPDVRHFYYKYLIKNQWVVQSGGLA